VRSHLLRENGCLHAEYVEVESGRRNDRPQLAAALVAAKKRKAILIIAKLDRLARNVYFISGLMESGVDFVAADNPNANRLMVHMLAAFAEHEREQISKRTKDALAAAKMRGTRLGRHGAEVLAPAHRSAAVRRAAELAPVLGELTSAGLSARAIAAELTRRRVPTPRGGAWHAQTVLRMLNRLGVGAPELWAAKPSLLNPSISVACEGQPGQDISEVHHQGSKA
jgi:DNA invertase Pin-like site-specific DNA recombinase